MNIPVVGKNIKELAGTQIKKFKTKFNKKEKQLLKQDPDKIGEMLMNKMTPEETKDMKTLIKTAGTIATATIAVGHLVKASNVGFKMSKKGNKKRNPNSN